MQDDIITPDQVQPTPTMGSDSSAPVPMPSTTPLAPMGSDDNSTAPLPPLGTDPTVTLTPNQNAPQDTSAVETPPVETPATPTIPTESFASVQPSPTLEPTASSMGGMAVESPVVAAPEVAPTPDIPTNPNAASTSFNAMPGVVPTPASAVDKKKNKNLLVLIILLVVVALAAAAYLLVLNKSDDTASKTTTSTTVVAEKVDPGTTDTSIDESMAALDDTKDFSSTDLSDTTLGL